MKRRILKLTETAFIQLFTYGLHRPYLVYTDPLPKDCRIVNCKFNKKRE